MDPEPCNITNLEINHVMLADLATRACDTSADIVDMLVAYREAFTLVDFVR